MSLQTILDSEKSQGDVPKKAVAIGLQEDGTHVYALHKEDESAEDARKRVKNDFGNKVKEWIHFEPANPGVEIEEDLEKKKKKTPIMEDASSVNKGPDLEKPGVEGVITEEEVEKELPVPGDQGEMEAEAPKETDTPQTSVETPKEKPRMSPSDIPDRIGSSMDFSNYFNRNVSDIITKGSSDDTDDPKKKKKKEQGGSRSEGSITTLKDPENPRLET